MKSQTNPTFPQKDEGISRILHWSFAFFVILMVTLGIYMTKTEYSLPLYQLHKSLGVLFTLLIGFRIYWTISHPWKSSFYGSRTEMIARRFTHLLLIILLLAMPITGLLSSAYSGFSVHLFDIIIVPENLNAAGEIEPINNTIYQAAKFLHRILGYFFAGMILLHILAVLKHHFINKDRVLLKMLTGK